MSNDTTTDTDPVLDGDLAVSNAKARQVLQRGASLVEYALLVALIALVCVAAVKALGTSTAVPYTSATAGLSG